jgi:hypothetical protein
MVAPGVGEDPKHSTDVESHPSKDEGWGTLFHFLSTPSDNVLGRYRFDLMAES